MKTLLAALLVLSSCTCSEPTTSGPPDAGSLSGAGGSGSTASVSASSSSGTGGDVTEGLPATVRAESAEIVHRDGHYLLEMSGVSPVAELMDGHEAPVWSVITRLPDEAPVDVTYAGAPSPVRIVATSVSYDPEKARMTVAFRFVAGTMLAVLADVEILIP